MALQCVLSSPSSARSMTECTLSVISNTRSQHTISSPFCRSCVGVSSGAYAIWVEWTCPAAELTPVNFPQERKGVTHPTSMKGERGRSSGCGLPTTLHATCWSQSDSRRWSSWKYCSCIPCWTAYKLFCTFARSITCRIIFVERGASDAPPIPCFPSFLLRDRDMDMILDAYEGGLKVSSAMHYCRIWEYIKFHREVICTVVTIVMAYSPCCLESPVSATLLRV